MDSVIAAAGGDRVVPFQPVDHVIFIRRSGIAIAVERQSDGLRGIDRVGDRHVQRLGVGQQTVTDPDDHLVNVVSANVRRCLEVGRSQQR